MSIPPATRSWLFNEHWGQGISAEVNDHEEVNTMKFFGIEETIAKAIRQHAHFDSMSKQTDKAMWHRHHERAHIALWMLWQSLADQLGMSCGAINECRTAEENMAFLKKCGIADDVVRNVITNGDDNWGSY